MPVHLLICAITHRSMTKSIKISVLWLLTICGFAAHSIYDVLPMFWGKNMAVVATDGNVDQGMIVFIRQCRAVCYHAHDDYRWYRAGMV